MATKNKEDNSNGLERISAYSNLAMVILTAIGLFFLYFELRQFRSQTVTLEESLRQTYKPLLVALTDTLNQNNMVVKHTNISKDNKLTITSRVPHRSGAC